MITSQKKPYCKCINTHPVVTQHQTTLSEIVYVIWLLHLQRLFVWKSNSDDKRFLVQMFQTWPGICWKWFIFWNAYWTVHLKILNACRLNAKEIGEWQCEDKIWRFLRMFQKSIHFEYTFFCSDFHNFLSFGMVILFHLILSFEEIQHEIVSS